MIEIKDKSLCSGCTACEAVCAHKAINMTPDGLGFLYPEVDVSRCVNCGLCDAVCNFKAPPDRREGFPQSFLMKHRDPEEVLKSKSGGAFVLLSDVILNEGGVIYGAELNPDHLVQHNRAVNKEERDKFRGSKYIQSDLKNTFIQVRSDLLKGKKVMFSGTPCQIAGLKSFIGPKLSTHLYLVDLFCHGVAAPAIWKDWISTIERRKKQKIFKCIPRNPKYGWDNSIDTFLLQNGKEYNSDYFTGYIYHKWITQRWSCDVCPFTSLNRNSDVTIGDAWGADKVAPGFDSDNLGSSIVLANTAKGQELLKKAAVGGIIESVDIQKMMQPVLKYPTTLHPKRQQFEDSYLRSGFKRTRFLYLNNTLEDIKARTRKILRKIKHFLYR